VLLLDSLKAHEAQTVVMHLRNYLQNCWDDKMSAGANEPGKKPARGAGPASSTRRKFNADSVPVIKVDVPQQQNSCDCGVFILVFIETFLRQLPLLCSHNAARVDFASVARKFANSFVCGKRWFGSREPLAMRRRLDHAIRQMMGPQSEVLY
jgi:hypothetical protein